jgi:hypothetical protein
MLLNKDPLRWWSVTLRDQAGAPFAGALDQFQLSRAQYAWHARGARGYPKPEGPPARSRVAAGQAVTLPPHSLTVVRSAG